MMTLVTGASGFTGSHVVRALAHSGAAVRAMVRPSSDCSRLQGLDVDVAVADITSRASLDAALRGVTTVIHTAAAVSLGIVDEWTMTQVNVDGTRNLLDAALDCGVRRFVHCSTIGVLGDTKGEVVDETFCRVQEEYSSVYDRTKHEAQKLVDAYGKGRLEVVSVLPSGILGYGDPHFGQMIERFLAGRLAYGVGNKRIVSVVHVGDVAGALLLAAAVGRRGEWYIASAGELTGRRIFELLGARKGIAPPREIPEAIVRAIGCGLEPIGRVLLWNPPLSRERVRYIYDRCVRVNASKIRRELGWKPRSPERTVEAIMEQGGSRV